MATIAGDKSVYNANTNWDNEEKYLSGLAKGGNAWASEQLKALQEAKAMYTGGSASGSAYGYNSMIEDIYKSQLDAALAEIKSAYDRNIADLDAARAKIPALYQQQRNRMASDAAVNAQNFGEYAAASGLSSGADAQARLSMNNQLTSGLSNLSQSEAEAISALETERAKISADYQNAVARAIAEGNANKARALYEEAIRVDEIIRAEEAAKSRAATGPTGPTPPKDLGTYYDALNTTASAMNRDTPAGRAYIEDYILKQVLADRLTIDGAEQIFANLGM